MRILLLVPDMNIGGVTTVVKNLYEGLKIKKDEVKLICIKADENYSSLNSNRKIDLFKAIANLKKNIDHFNPDLVHSHTIFSHILILIYKFIYNKKIKVICTEHGSFQESNKYNILFIIFGALARLANEVVFVSDFSRKSYIKNNIVSEDKTKVIYNGISIGEVNFSKKLDDKYKFCYVGRFSTEKNLFLLIDAFSNLKTDKNKILYLIGDGEIRKELESYCLDKKINNVIFLGFRKDVLNIIETMDCLVLSSLTEGLPTVVLEAYTKCTLAISTNCGGINEIIKDKRFISKGFDVESMIDVMHFVVNIDESEALECLENNYNFVSSKFSLSKMVDIYSKLYREVIAFD